MEVRGEWRPCALNEDFLFGNYPAKGGFAPHSDGATAKGLNLRSFYSVIIYLNTPSEGGGTRFYQSSATDVVLDEGRWTGRKDLAVFEVQPLMGRALVFDQRLVHEGIPPIGDRKHIIRTDVMFERIEPLFVEYASADTRTTNGPSICLSGVSTRTRNSFRPHDGPELQLVNQEYAHTR